MSQLAPAPVPGVRFFSNGPHLNPECTSIRPGRMILFFRLFIKRPERALCQEEHTMHFQMCVHCHQNLWTTPRAVLGVQHHTHSSPRMWAIQLSLMKKYLHRCMSMRSCFFFLKKKDGTFGVLGKKDTYPPRDSRRSPGDPLGARKAKSP